jgi:Flp pilus assembly protein TadB
MLPSLDGMIMALISAGFGVGLVLLAVFVRGITPQPAKPPSRLSLAVQALRSPALSGRLACGVVGGVLALVLTRWPVAGAGVAALVIFWPQMFGGQRLEQTQILQLEALVMWTESLRDTITARASLEQAIPATASTAPAPIRPALTRLTGLVRSRVPLDRALLALSAELNDGSADKVIGSLILNTRQRGTGLGAVLTSLASSARAELDQRRRVSAGRATMRRSVQIVVIITIAFAVFLVLFSREYIKPYGTVGGQVALAVVVGLFAAAFTWMRKLAGGEPSTPFLSRAEARIDDADLRVVAHLTGVSQEQAQELTTNRPVRAAASPTNGTRR